MTVIAVIDDRITNRKILEKLAASLEPGALVRAFGVPEEALDWVRNNTPDLVVTDFKMPGMNGAEFTAAFRRLPLCYDVPVMVVTVSEDRELRYQALEAGATDFLNSPIDHREFRVRARNLLTLRSQRKFIKRRALELEERLRSDGRQHEKEMHRKGAQLLSVIDSVPAMISATDRDGRYVFVNRYLASVAGTTPDAAVGKTPDEVFGDRRSRDGDCHDSRIFLTGESPPPWEEQFIDLGGHERTLLIGKQPIRDGDNQIIQVLTFARDITERKLQLEELVRARNEAETANRSKTEFLANMSHELRTPLNAIIGFSEMISGQTFGPVGDDRYVEYAGDVNTSAIHLLGIINDILEVSKIEAGQIGLDEQIVNLMDTVSDVVRIVHARAEEAGLRIEIEGAADLPDLLADERKLKQILLNLCSNGIKFTPAGGTVTIATRVMDDRSVEIAVSDTGIGIAAEDIPRALERFGRIGNVMTNGTPGTGLGLPLSRSLVELHGGRMDLASEVGKGTTVTVTLPPDRSVVADAGKVALHG